MILDLFDEDAAPLSDVPHPPSLAESFRDFDEKNPHVWRLFERCALELASRGLTFGSKAVYEDMRWEMQFGTTEADEGSFKLNNNYTAFYARKFQAAYPQFAELVKTRKQKAIQ